MQKLDILYVEDDPLDATLLREQFRREDPESYNITHCSNFSDALSNIKSRQYGIILLDLNLPDGNGLENIESIKQVSPDTPVVILTNISDEKKAETAVKKGAQEYIIKGQATGRAIKQILQSSILRKKAEQELFHLAHHDSLTGLPNRTSFEETAKMLIKRAERWDRKEALIFIDLNKFKEINDTHGHEAGNEVLKEVAGRLKKTLRQSDLIARYAGDEFVVYLDSSQNTPITEKLCAYVAEKIIAGVQKPFQVNGKPVDILLSIGIAIFPDAAGHFDTLMKCADSAMYKAKNEPEKNFWIIGKKSGQGKTKIEKFLQTRANDDEASTETDKTILIIDDSPADCMLYKKMLDGIPKNYKVLEANTIIQGRKILQTEKPDCVLLDYNLPGINGLGFLEDAQQQNGKKINIAVIIATDRDDRAAAVESMKMGAQDYLVKNEINKNCLARAINNAIEKNDLNRQLGSYQQRLEESNEELSEFAHTVAHDLKAPLRRIYTFCDMLAEQNGNQNEDTRHIIQKMKVNSERLQKLIDTLLVYAQIMRSKEERETTCLTKITNEILEDIDIMLKEKKATVTVDKLPVLSVFPIKMRQLFLNLIVNALKYNHEDRDPVIKISQEVKDGLCTISIQDNGMGISKSKLTKIFKPFCRLHSNDQIEGTGLGLSICRKVVKKHGGDIWAHSNEGEGTTFKFSLPVEVEKQKPVEKAA